jgi:RNA polymerase sigma-70 factor, ECF subfamily
MTAMAGRAPDQGGGLDPKDFDGLVAEHAPALFRLARSLGADPARAEDLVQETFLRAYERRDQHRGGSVQGWFRRILHNLAVDHARAPSRREVPVAEVESRWADDAYTVDVAEVVERAQMREELEDALVHLPFPYRAAVVLHDVEGWPSREIADAMDITLPAAKQRLRRGRMMLVTALAAGAERRAALAGVPLKCWDARQQVSGYLDGELPPAVSATLERHLAGCPTCPPLYGALVGVRDGLDRLRDPDSVIPPGLAARALDRLASADAEPG